MLFHFSLVHPGQKVKSLPHATVNQCIQKGLTSSCCLLLCVDNMVGNVGP